MPTISQALLSTLLIHLVRQHVRTRWIVRHHKAGRRLLLSVGAQIRELIDSGNASRMQVRELFRSEREFLRYNEGGDR